MQSTLAKTKQTYIVPLLIINIISVFTFFTVQELTELLEMFSGSNLKGIYGNHTCLSLQTSIDENDENLTTVHHRYLRKFKANLFSYCR